MYFVHDLSESILLDLKEHLMHFGYAFESKHDICLFIGKFQRADLSSVTGVRDMHTVRIKIST